MNERLTKIIFRKLYEDLSHVEIISYKDSIWFVDREEKYWYLEYEKSGILWWRHLFFNGFFGVFSIERDEYEPIISEWVEEVLNCKVDTPIRRCRLFALQVEEVLNCKVNRIHSWQNQYRYGVEEVLNCKVITPKHSGHPGGSKVEEVLKYKVITPINGLTQEYEKVEEVLNCKVIESNDEDNSWEFLVGDVLKQ